jgi:hypothetical protein
VLFIGSGLESNTFFHCVEEIAECSWGLSEAPEPLYSITADGCVLSVPSRRHRNGVSDNFPRLENSLLQAGMLVRAYLGGCCPLRLLDAPRAAAWLTPQLREQPRLLW